MTKPELEREVDELEPELVTVYYEMAEFVKCAADTLSDSFQIACQIFDVFKKYAEKRRAER